MTIPLMNRQSYSRLGVIMECPWLDYAERVLGHRAPRAARPRLGSMSHEGLALLWRTEGGASDEEIAEACVSAVLTRDGEPVEWRDGGEGCEADLAAAPRVARRVFEHLLMEGFKPWADNGAVDPVEGRLEIPLPIEGWVWKQRTDLLALDRRGTPTLIDYKGESAAFSPRDMTGFPQLAYSRHALGLAGVEVTRTAAVRYRLANPEPPDLLKPPKPTRKHPGPRRPTRPQIKDGMLTTPDMWRDACLGSCSDDPAPHMDRVRAACYSHWVVTVEASSTEAMRERLWEDMLAITRLVDARQRRGIEPPRNFRGRPSAPCNTMTPDWSCSARVPCRRGLAGLTPLKGKA